MTSKTLSDTRKSKSTSSTAKSKKSKKCDSKRGKRHEREDQQEHDIRHPDTPPILMSTPNPVPSPVPLLEIVPDPPNRLKRVKNDGVDGRNGTASAVSAAT